MFNNISNCKFIKVRDVNTNLSDSSPFCVSLGGEACFKTSDGGKLKKVSHGTDGAFCCPTTMNYEFPQGTKHITFCK